MLSDCQQGGETKGPQLTFSFLKVSICLGTKKLGGGRIVLLAKCTDTAMRRVKGWQEWGKQERAAVPTVDSFVVTWNSVWKVHSRLDMQVHFSGSICQYMRAVGSVAFPGQTHFTSALPCTLLSLLLCDLFTTFPLLCLSSPCPNVFPFHHLLKPVLDKLCFPKMGKERHSEEPDHLLHL